MKSQIADSSVQGRMSVQRPVVSIIVVVFQAAAELRELIRSITPHLCREVELIVIDGGSTDGTLDVLREYEDMIDRWVSERDEGIYDAMNKGIALARGQFFLHLNAGDRLLNLPLQDLSAALDDGVDVAAFCVLVNDFGQFRPSAGLALHFTNTLHHQGTFFRKDSFLAYDTSYKIFADFDANQKLAARGARVRIFNTVVASHANDGVSHNTGTAEFFEIIRRNYGYLYVGIAWLLCKWRGLKFRLRRMCHHTI